VSQIVKNLDPTSRSKLRAGFSSDLSMDTQTLQQKVQAAPSNSTFRRELLLPQFLGQNEKAGI
jgi:hypothetical protein